MPTGTGRKGGILKRKQNRVSVPIEARLVRQCIQIPVDDARRSSLSPAVTSASSSVPISSIPTILLIGSGCSTSPQYYSHYLDNSAESLSNSIFGRSWPISDATSSHMYPSVLNHLSFLINLWIQRLHGWQCLSYTLAGWWHSVCA